MKKTRISLIAVLALLLCSCAQSPSATGTNRSLESYESPAVSASSQPLAESPQESAEALPAQAAGSQSGDESAISSQSQPDMVSASGQTEDRPEPAPQIPAAPFSPADIGAYFGEPCAAVNGNVPYFSEEELTTQSFESYSELDSLGRCGVAYACVGLDLMPTEERGSIGNVRPTGWHTIKYNDIIDGNYLYNRCHLIGYLLSGENANERNLITGTRYLNVQGMLPYENMIADYVTESGNHVLYRVTPVFEGENLLASGVLMEARSVEDGGEAISFCVYAYNVQPGIAIDYATGESAVAPDAQVPASAPPESIAPSREPDAESAAAVSPERNPEPTGALPQESAPAPEQSPTQDSGNQPAQEPSAEPGVSQEEQPQGTAYILNTNTHKFHYPTCRSVKQMKETNKQDYTGNRDDIISMGYEPCKNCNP